MRTSDEQTNLFDLAPGLFKPPQVQTATPDIAWIRQRLHDLLATARAAERMPWNPQRERVNELIFNQSANWLPEAERDPLRAQFRVELDRLRAAQ